MTVPLLLCLVLLGQFAPADVGELRVVVTDASRLGVPAHVTIQSSANQVERSLQADAAGVATARRLPFGAYRVRVTFEGFAPAESLVELRSAVPFEHRVTLTIAAVAASVDVSTETTLLDPRQTMTVRRVGAEMLGQRADALPGRALPELINTQPGWLLEAGGTLHPRGSENQTQYVVDGLPITDNRSPGFAPELDADNIQGIGVITGGYPAEYGRKLGGVIEVTTIGDSRRGVHGDVGMSLSSFSTRSVDAGAGYGGHDTTVFAGISAAATDRYLDPPVEDNYTNHGTSWQGTGRIERGRLGAIVSRAEIGLEVPNDPEQEQAGQRQRRTSAESAVKLSYQLILSGPAVLAVNGMFRDLDARLFSNEHATPIFATQHRGLREGYVKAANAGHRGRHEWKVGADTSIGHLREAFGYRISDPGGFPAGIQQVFDFRSTAIDREHAAFIQDQLSAKTWTVKAGLRWDAYRLLVRELAFSPRIAAAWSPHQSFSLRGSYDRAFQTPAIENLLLASSPTVDTLAPAVVRLPVRPSHGNFYEVAATQRLFGAARIDLSWFERRASHFADDDLLLNTGVSFPIAFRRATVHGSEIRLDVPRWRSLSGFVSYGWMRGQAELPVTGGLFLGDEIDLGRAGDTITITQDQRHTARWRFSAQLSARAWLAAAGALDSGLPFEDEGEDAETGAVPPRILERINPQTGRVRPAATVDLSAGWKILRSRDYQLQLQLDVRNATNTFRVINFAGVLSGTALAAPRTVAVRLRASF